jgi:hypothetical protein
LSDGSEGTDYLRNLLTSSSDTRRVLAAQAAVNFTRTVSPEALGDIQQQLAEQALQALPASAGVPSMDNLQRQLNAAVLNFTFANAAFSATMPSSIYPGQKALTTGSLRVG